MTIFKRIIDREIPAEILFEDEKGRWHTETARGSDRPDTSVKDKG